MSETVRVMVERRKKKRVVACAFDWPRWDRSGKSEEEALGVLAIRDYNARGAPARTWTVQFVIRRCAWHMLDHAWEMEDRDLSNAP